ncbi:MAG: hypothetical protein HY211_05805 [Candidatus Omnitrophica bacterium]|nr:hypothetical protein [Candidatus Omnitrophota bacterium]
MSVLLLAIGAGLLHIHDESTANQAETCYLYKILEENLAALPVSPLIADPVLFIAPCIFHPCVSHHEVFVVRPAFPRAPPALVFPMISI